MLEEGGKLFLYQVKNSDRHCNGTPSLTYFDTSVNNEPAAATKGTSMNIGAGVAFGCINK